MDNGGDYTRQSPYLWSGVPHYYGDIVRQLLISAAALVLLGAPFYAEDLRAELPFEIMGAIVFVALGALLNPHSKLAIFANVIAGFLCQPATECVNLFYRVIIFHFLHHRKTAPPELL